MGRVTKDIACLTALLFANLRAHHAEPRRTLTLSTFMLLQNMMFFILWLVFFGAIRNVKGWQLSDVALMYGAIAFSVGSAMFVADGARTLTLRIQDGSIDAFLTRPRHPLPALLFSRSGLSSLGDMASGPVLWFVVGKATPAQLPGLLGISLLAAVILLSATIMFFSLAFWLKRGSRFSDQLFETLLIFSTVPQQGQPIGVKVVMFSVLPAGFISLLPVSLMRHFDPAVFAVLAAAAVGYAWLSVLVFNAGVRKYVEG